MLSALPTGASGGKNSRNSVLQIGDLRAATLSLLPNRACSKPTKSGTSRSIGLDDFALGVLTEHREGQDQDRHACGSAYRPNNLIFCQPNGDFYSPDHVGTRTKALLRKAGYSNFSLHSLRHSHASILLGNGTPLAVVSERLGHANQDITLGLDSHSLPADRKSASRVWHAALAHVISEDRRRRSVQALASAEGAQEGDKAPTETEFIQQRC